MRIGNSNFFHVIGIILLLLIAAVCEVRAEELTVSNAWMRALPSSVPSGGYFTLHNGENRDVILIGADSPACGMLMLHKSSDMGGMSEMNEVADVKVAAGSSIAFAPGGLHLMCMDVTAALKPGGKVPVTLIFDGDRKLTVQFAVRNAMGK
jgi:hypothetical protein